MKLYYKIYQNCEYISIIIKKASYNFFNIIILLYMYIIINEKNIDFIIF